MRELEAKLQFDQIEVASLLDILQHHGHEAVGPVVQVDYVYARTRGDIEQPQEGTVVARVRVQDSGASLTVKVRRLADLDRSEHETEVADAEAARSILVALGLRQVLTISKKRWGVTLGDGVSLCVDEVERLGVFLEVEVIADDADERDAQEKLATTLAALGALLGDVGREVDKGYDRLLLELNE